MPASFSQLADNFADNSMARAWTTTLLGSGTVSEASGRATCTLPNATAGTHQAYYKSVHTYDLTGAAAYVTINGMVATGVAALFTFDVFIDGSSVYRWWQQSGTLKAQKVVGGATTDLYSVTWNATTHKYLRISESGGTVSFDTSSNGTAWTNRATQTVAGAFAVTSLYVQFGAQCGNVASPGALTVEDFNTLSLSTTWRWVQGSRAYQHRIGSATIAATGGVGYLAVAASVDASGNLVSPTYYSGPLADGRELTAQTLQADAQAMAPRLPTAGRWHVPPGVVLEGRYCRLYLRSHDGASFVLREFYPRRYIEADDIAAESITAIKIAASSITADRLSVLQLSAITADLGSITAGTITGATIQTATSGARIELTSANGLRSYNSGGTVQVQLRTSDGALTWAGGLGTLSASGMTIKADDGSGSSYVAETALQWLDGSNALYASIKANAISDASLPPSVNRGLRLEVPSGSNSSIVLKSDTLYMLGEIYSNNTNGANFAFGPVKALEGFRAPRSNGTARFAIDASGTGSSLTIASTAQATPFSNANVFAGLIIIQEIGSTGWTAMFLTGGAGIVELADISGQYTVTAGNAGTTNVYLSSGIVVIQNLSGASRTYNVVAVRINATN